MRLSENSVWDDNRYKLARLRQLAAYSMSLRGLMEGLVLKFMDLYKKLLKYFCAIFFSKKKFSLPNQKDILVYGGTGKEHLLRLLQGFEPEILFIGGEELNVFVMMKAFFRKGNFLENYEDVYMEFVRPVLVVTRQDNSEKFYKFSSRNNHVKTIFVQNGWRGGTSDVFHNTLSKLPSQATSYSVNLMCTYGAAIGREYSKYIKGKFVAVGSFLSNECPVAKNKKVKRIAYISMPISKDEHQQKMVEAVLASLLKYSRSREIVLAIVGRMKPGTAAYNDEEQYYRQLLGDGIEFKKREGQHSSYQYLDESEVSVSIDTSLGYETVARGNKNAFFSIFGKFFNMEEFDFGWPAKYPGSGPFWTNDFDTASFEKILDHLFAISHEQWLSELVDCKYANLIIYDSGNAILRGVIDEMTSDARHEQA